MKFVVALLVTLVGTTAFAQELGNEIPDRQPVNPAPVSAQQPAPSNPVNFSSKKSSSSMSFGLLAGFQSSPIPSAPLGLGGSAVVGPLSPTVGMKFFVLDAVAFLFEVGASIGLGGNEALVGFDAAIGIDLLFGSPENALRPLAHFKVGFGKPFGPGTDMWVIHAAVGGGGEYFFTPQVSLTARATIAVPLTLANGNLSVLITTLSPALLATFYFDAPAGMGSKR